MYFFKIHTRNGARTKNFTRGTIATMAGGLFTFGFDGSGFDFLRPVNSPVLRREQRPRVRFRLSVSTPRGLSELLPPRHFPKRAPFCGSPVWGRCRRPDATATRG